MSKHLTKKKGPYSRESFIVRNCFVPKFTCFIFRGTINKCFLTVVSLCEWSIFKSEWLDFLIKFTLVSIIICNGTSRHKEILVEQTSMRQWNAYYSPKVTTFKVALTLVSVMLPLLRHVTKVFPGKGLTVIDSEEW